MAVWLFFVCFGLIAYVYFGYPALLWLFTRKKEKLVRSAERPPVSMIVAAYNEEIVITEKLENTLNQTYPPDRLEVIVASDGSDDRTDAIVRSYADRGVALHRSPERRGKMTVLMDAVQQATGEILVFSDANAMYASDALERLVEPFADVRTGCVCGRLVYENRHTTSISDGERMYWSYENRLKTWESVFNSLIGANGSIYALRRSAFVPLDPDVSDDFGLPLAAYAGGYRTVFQPEAVSREEAPATVYMEFRKKRRFVAHQLITLVRLWSVLKPFQDPKLLFQLVSHKLLRNAVPFFLMGMFGASLAISSPFGAALVNVQAVFYTLAAVGLSVSGAGRPPRIFSVPLYFFTVNAAAVGGIVDFLRKKNYAAWNEVRPAP
ncbi:MAG: glycosyltransferase family 2 protein [candidate division Zixibacteria bacterium]|nr:glycosyltransferase family 2 protein [candidate division Zixibacteria bacterium]